MAKRKIKRFGYKPDLGDHRDLRYVKVNAPRPKSVDLRSKMPPCWDQNQLGCCSGFGITAVVTHLHGFIGSQLWLYYMERKIEGTTRSDSGAAIRDGIKVIATQGLPPLESWPYDITKFTKAPPADVNALAQKELIKEYRRLNDVDDYLDCLASGFPFVVGISVFDSLESEEVARTGIVPMPTMYDQMVGGHCISVFGYTEQLDFICRNSWGADWGMNGYFILPHDYMASPDLASDAWMITKD